MLMDMHGIEIGRILFVNIGQAEDFRFRQDTAVWGVIKFNQAAQLRIGTVSGHPCYGTGAVFL